MSNSDLNFKDNKTIYEIFRACRLCGAGGGYKMPIIQDVVGLDCDIELKQKIRECVQIEVSEDDKMPPLICELCVDKVNDFYEFLDMCRQTNKRTRTRLGLPPQAVQEASDGDCILGITETVYANESENSRARPTSKPRPKSVKLKEEQKKISKEEKSKEEKNDQWKDEKIKSLTRELQNLIQLQLANKLSPRESRQRENSRDSLQKETPKESRLGETSRESRQRGTSRESLISETSRESRKRETSKETRQREFRSTIVNRTACKGRASPPTTRETRQNAAEGENFSLSVIRKNDLKKNEKPASQPTRPTKETPSKSILKKEKEKKVENEDSSLLVPLGKRSRDKTETLVADLASKRVKITIKLPPSPKVILDKASKKEDKVEKPAKLEKATKKEIKVDKPAAKLEKATKKDVKVEKPAKLEKAIKKVEEVGKFIKKEDVVDNSEENFDCNICGRSIKTNAGLSNHLKFSHIPNFTSCLLACNACGLWFENDDQTAAHHKRYHNTQPYHCRWCKNDFKLHKTYTAHFHKEHCVPCPLKAFMCTKCSKKFDTKQLRAQHSCVVIKPTASSSSTLLPAKTLLVPSLPAKTLPAKALPAKSLPTPSLPAPSLCGKQRGRNFSQKTLKKQEFCSAKKRSILDEVRISPRVRSRLLPVRVRVARCDPLLKRGRCCASQVPSEFGLDQNTVYPYLSTRIRIKSEPFIADGMVSINKDIKDEWYTEEDYVHWDSDLSSSDDEYDNVDPKKRVDALFTLSLKTIFSRRCLGKVPRKLRKLKTEKFDLFNEYDMSSDISKIINNLGGNDAVNYDSDSLLEHGKEKRVVNSEFDSIFNDSKSQNDVSLNDETDSSRNNASLKDNIDKNKDTFSMGSETDASVNEPDKILNKTKEIEGAEINNVESMDTSNIADDLKDKVTTESKNEQDTDRNPTVAVSKEINNVESMDTSTAGEEMEKKICESDKVGANESNQNGIIEGNEESSRLNDKNGYEKENNSAESEKCSEKVNGDAEKVDTARLMDEIDAQIEGGCQNNDKVGDDKNAGDRKSLGTENISDEEFNFDA